MISDPGSSRRSMIGNAGLCRRGFLQAAAAFGGALMLRIPVCSAETSSTDASFAPNAFVTVRPDGKVVLTMPYVEMGQGTYTSIPMLLAEELDVDFDQVELRHAPADEAHYANPLLGVQATGNSNAIRGAWLPLRMAGATARQMLVAAAARRWGTEPSACRTARGEVIHSPTGQRAGYGMLTADAARLPTPDSAPLKDRSDFNLIGTPAKRLDTRSKVDGSAIYGIDARPHGLKFATLMQSPVRGGRLKSLDDAAAKAVSGVRQIVVHQDAVAVVADHMGAAKKGLDALAIEWHDGPNGRLSTEDIASDLRAAARSPGVVAQSVGAVDAAMPHSAARVEATYEVPFLAHAAMEPANCTAHVWSNGCEIWVGTQAIARARAAAAEAAGLGVDQVLVHNHLIGGGFGRRLESDYVTRAVEIAKRVDGPVKVVWTREEDIRQDMYRPMFVDVISAGLGPAGMPVAWRNRFAGPSIIARWLPAAYANGLDPDTVEGAIDLPYEVPNVLVEYVRREPQGVPTAFWRSVGPSHNVFVTESFIDELAAAAGKDPVEYRLQLLNRTPRARAVLALAADKAGWGEALPPRSGRGVSVQHVFGTYMAHVAEVDVAADGAVRVRRVVCAVDCGMVVNPDTVHAQVQGAVVFGITAALHGNITFANGRVQQGNFDDYRMLRIDEAPTVDVHIVHSDEDPGGMGEAGTSAIVPAVTNAIFAATGKRLRRLPVDPRVLQQTG